MEASKSSEGKYLDDPDGGVETWEGGRDDGGSVRAGLSSVRKCRCGESAVPPRRQGSACAEKTTAHPGL